MRELELSISDALRSGIIPYRTSPFGTPMLKDCMGFRCGKYGLEPYEELDSNIPETIPLSYTWPYPQMLVGENYRLLIVRNTFTVTDYVYSISDDFTTAVLIATIPSIESSPPNMPQMADFGLYAYFTNGVRSYYFSPPAPLGTGTWTQVTFPNEEVPLMRTICNFRGQAVGGNVLGTWYDCDETYLLWSNIGHFDFSLNLRNEAGYRRCPYGGVVRDVKVLDKAVICYTSNGISALVPAIEPAPTYGLQEVSNVGILNQGAVNGDSRRHLFIRQDYDLAMISSEGLKEIGYGHLLRDLEGHLIVNYDKLKGDFYVGNSDKTYLLSPQGLTEIPQHPSTAWNFNSNLHILPDSIDDYEPLIVSEPLDMGYKGYKTVFTIETDATGVEQPRAGVDFINNLNTWIEGNYKPINNQGIATNIISGSAFRFKLLFNSISEDFRIGYIKSRYKMTDLRGIRGVYAPPIRGQHAD